MFIIHNIRISWLLEYLYKILGDGCFMVVKKNSVGNIKYVILLPTYNTVTMRNRGSAQYLSVRHTFWLKCYSYLTCSRLVTNRIVKYCLYLHVLHFTIFLSMQDITLTLKIARCYENINSLINHNNKTIVFIYMW